MADTINPNAVFSPPVAGVSVGAQGAVVVVAYTDDVAIDQATIDADTSADIRIVNSAIGFSAAAVRFVSAPLDPAYYYFDAPGGSWGAEDNGTYEVIVNASQITDTSGNFVAAGKIGEFLIELAPPASIVISALAADKSEGNTGTTGYTFSLTRTGDLSATASVAYSITGLGATPAVAADFVGGALPSGTVNFAAGETSRSITVNVAGDAAVEGDEQFSVSLSNAVGATLTAATASASGTIRNDDATAVTALPVVSLALGPTSIQEGGTFTLTVSRSGADLSAPTTVSYTISGAAAGSSDIATPLTGTVTIAANQTSAALTIATVEDANVEQVETFSVTLSNPGNATLGSASTATGTVTDDDTAATTPNPGTTPAALNPITGTSTGEELQGTAGNDVMRALAGDDRVFGNGGDDLMVAAQEDGRDRYDGGEGTDTIDYSALTGGVSAWLGRGGGCGSHHRGQDRLVSIENAIGSQGDDRISGNRAANVIEGGTGDDWMRGGGGGDKFVFKAGFGNDRIRDFDANPDGGQDLIELAGFGITSANFAARVAIEDIGRHTLVTIDDEADQTIQLSRIGNSASITIDDFRFI